MHEHDNNLLICLICLEPVQLPVEPVCFPCCSQNVSFQLPSATIQGEDVHNVQQETKLPDNWFSMIHDSPSYSLMTMVEKMGCYALQRLCLFCFEMYIKSFRTRDSMNVKCLICTSRREHNIVFNENESNLKYCQYYKTDFMYMNRKPELPLSQRICRFCHESQPEKWLTQFDYYIHCRDICPDVYINCLCNQQIKRKDVICHIEHCEKYEKCNVCNFHIPLTGIVQHYNSQHHQTPCYMCGEYIPIMSAGVHFSTECNERLEPCFICLRMIRHGGFTSHLQLHLQEIEEEYHNTRNTLGTLQKNLRYIEEKFTELSVPFNVPRFSSSHVLSLPE